VRRLRLPSTLAFLVLVAACGLLQRGRSPVTGKLDVNTAALSELEQLPGVTPSMARRIFEGRPYGTLDELVERGLLSERELERVRNKVKVGGPPRERQ
jgi:radical SAM superfamily enzyme with C-terminal helix-hairpin-helix motif